MSKVPIILGEKPKLTISTPPIAGAYTLGDINWRVEFYASRGSVYIDKADATKVDDNTYIVRVDTSKTGTGKLYGILYPSIPDREMPAGYYAPPVPFDPDERVVSPYYMSDGLSD